MSGGYDSSKKVSTGQSVRPGSPPAGLRILVMGAGGFLGPFIVARLRAAGHDIRTAGRADVGTIDRNTDWRAVVKDIDTVVHLAGRAHVMREDTSDPLEAYREVNLYGTAKLAKAAADAGVRRFVFMSSLKVMGEIGLRLAPDHEPDPQDPYAVSKVEAELALREMGEDMEIVVLRPPLVYGPGVKGNFLRLLKAVRKGIPLPFGLIDNSRSLIYAENLADAVCHALSCRPDTYHPRDAVDLSTPELVRLIGEGMGRPARLMPVPPILLKTGGMLMGRYPDVLRLTSSFTCDGRMDGWVPPYDTADAVRATARSFLDG